MGVCCDLSSGRTHNQANLLEVLQCPLLPKAILPFLSAPIVLGAHCTDDPATDCLSRINSLNGFSSHIYASENKGVIYRHSGIALGMAVTV